ncbi:MAG: EscU/YscU/HrcU family type III secretion system export apparatus switch protein [Thermoguttaceae bacterium]
MPDHADKSVEPTPRRRQQARREGQVAKSQDLGSALMLLAGVGILMSLGGGLVGFLVSYCRSQLGGQPWLAANADFITGQWNATLWTLARCLLPILGLLCLAGVAVNLLQTGFLFLPQRVSVDLGRISPIRGWQRIFSSARMVHLGFGLLILTAVIGVAGVVLYNQREALLGLIALPPPALAAEMAQLMLWTALKIGAALLVLAILDYGYQRWRHEQDLRMTPQELREELKNLEGDPQLRARRKRAQHELAVGRAPPVQSPAAETQADGLKR